MWSLKAIQNQQMYIKLAHTSDTLLLHEVDAECIVK